MSALLALFATFLLAQPAGAQEGADFLPLAQGNDTGIGGTDQALTCERQIAI